MLRLLALSATALALAAADVPPAAATGLTIQAGTPAKERCEDLVAFFDRWGTSRGEHTDGARNHTRIAANIDCERGDYAAGIRQMEELLADKRFEVPVEVGEAPLYYPEEGATEPAAAR